MRTEKVAFNVPVDILASLKIGARGLESDMRRSLAVQYFKNKRLSLGKSAKLAGMNRIDFMDHLAAEGCVVFDYDESALKEELKGLGRGHVKRIKDQVKAEKYGTDSR